RSLESLALVEGDLRAGIVGRGRAFVGAPTSDLGALLAAAGIHRESLVDASGGGLHFIRQRWSGGRQYFLTNAGRDTLDAWVSLAHRAKAVAIMDPMTGRVGLAETRDSARAITQVHLQFAPGASVLLRTFSESAPNGAPSWTYRHIGGPRRVLRGPWS